MTTERSSHEAAGVDAVGATRDDRLTGTSLDDAAGTSTGSDFDKRYASSSSTSGAGSSMDRAGDRAAGVVDRVSGTAEKQANMGLARAGDAIAQAASALRQTGEQMRGQQPQVAGFADTAAQQLDKAAQLVGEQDLQGLLREAERFARRQPALFLGGAFVLGMAASRFLKASPEDGRSSGRGYESGYGARYGSGYGARYDSGYYSSTGYGEADRGASHETGYQAGGAGYGSDVGRAMSAAGTTATGDVTGAEHGRA